MSVRFLAYVYTADLPPTPEDLARRLRDDPATTPLAQLCTAVTRFFSSGDCLQAAFWPHREQQGPQQGQGQGQGPGVGIGSIGGLGGACPVDFTAVAALYDCVLGYGTEPPHPVAAAADEADGASLPPPSPSSSAHSPDAAAALLGRAGLGGTGSSRSIFRTPGHINGTGDGGGPGAEPGPGPGGGFTGGPVEGALSRAPPPLPAALAHASATASSILGGRLGNGGLALFASASPSATAGSLPGPSRSGRLAPLLHRWEDLAGGGGLGGSLSLSSPSGLRPTGPSSALGAALAAGVEGLLSSAGQLPAAVNPGLTRQLGVLLANPLLDRAEHHDLLASLVTFIGGLSARQRSALMELLATYPADELRRLLSRLHGFISITLFRMQSITRGVEEATRLVAMIHAANELAGQRAEAAAAAAADSGSRGLSGVGAGALGSLGSPGPGGGAAGGWSCGTAAGGGVGVGPVPGSAAGWRPLEPAAFYNDAINHEDFNLKEDFRKWKHVNELHSALFRGLFGGGGSPGGGAHLGGGGGGVLSDVCPFLVLRVRRGPYLVQDTLIQIHRAKETDSLKKPLKVKFIGEEGVDEGGVAKEFFQLLVRQLFNPDYGMFTADPDSHLHWFRPSRLELELEFELVGILIGLAIYNSHILEFQFPPVLYKKLMGATVTVTHTSPASASAADGGGAAEPATSAATAAAAVASPSGGAGGGAAGGTRAAAGSAAAAAAAGQAAAGGAHGGGSLGLEDLRELAPEVASSLRQLLAMEAGLVEGLGLVFQVDMEMGFGEVEPVDLLPGGGELSVTAANRRHYVDLYVKHLLQDSIAPQFEPFHRGFLRLCSGSALGWFSPTELELLVCGSRSLRMEELEAATLYDDGYTRDSEKRLLFFVTGSDRVPIKGLAALNPPFVISRAGPHSERLPSAHTCFNHMLLPHYNSKEVLRERLELALQNAEGFGLM
ncbi:hypothetical protein GPECTOR_117g371 [Gonium pectorale]|uniref:HECT-type E3 ubiquitin transferase n=1 Tax=Gonium pectorale TaxID=33097 RepID=A0A150FYV9_GONPE|nr:hypothetical protein GPECTOR_117g371 [Gonium pectorale]|eukprot:KXZ42806.1 hypothetical protein GPECTOR_117g371 [Gonium pectorale]